MPTMRGVLGCAAMATLDAATPECAGDHCQGCAAYAPELRLHELKWRDDVRRHLLNGDSTMLNQMLTATPDDKADADAIVRHTPNLNWKRRSSQIVDADWLANQEAAARAAFEESTQTRTGHRPRTRCNRLTTRKRPYAGLAWHGQRNGQRGTVPILAPAGLHNAADCRAEGRQNTVVLWFP